jgi:hypothetical protein
LFKVREMHGLVNKSIESFVSETYGVATWKQVANLAEFADPHFEAMMLYDFDVTERAIAAAVSILNADRADFLQNLGTFLVSNKATEGVRRLLRFGGVDFVEFLYSLDDLHERARIAVPDLLLPSLELREHTSVQYSLTIRSELAGFGYVMVGLLTAMADDYGALVMMDYGGCVGHVETIAIALLETSFAEGNHFALGASL